jgi:hypothetical protein
VEQTIEIIGWLGGERRAERQGHGERSHRTPSSFSIALGSAFASASVARIVPVGLAFFYLAATIVLRGSAAVNFRSFGRQIGVRNDQLVEPRNGPAKVD